MQFFLCSTIIALAVSCISGEQSPTFKEIVVFAIKKCAEIHNASADQTEIAYNQNLPKDETEKCVLLCLFTGLGVIQYDSFSLKDAMTVIDLRYDDPKEKQIASNIVRSCSREVKGDYKNCDLGMAIKACYVKYGKKMNLYLFPSI